MEKEEEHMMLHRLVDAEDPVEDVGAAAAALASASPSAEEEEEEEGGDEAEAEAEVDAQPAKGNKASAPPPKKVPPPATVLVARPPPSVVQLGAALLDRATGVLSALRVNVNRDAGPLDLALLKAR